MKFFFCLFLQMILASGEQVNQTIPLPEQDEYKLIWSDEFNTDGPPDSTKWKFEAGFTRNEEAQWYQEENAVCENGYLVITGKKERKPNPNYISGSTSWKTNRQFIDYTSSSVVMQQEHSFQYGKVEVRAKIDVQTGLWPAIWTLGTSGKWPANGEVDIMEYYKDGILASFAIEGNKQHQALWDGSSKTVEKGEIKPNKVNTALLSQIDLYASLASLAGVTVEDGQAPDSKNHLPVLLNQSKQPRQFLIEQSINATLSLVVDNWKYIEPSKGRKINKDTNTELGNDLKPQLYNLADDAAETKNLAEVYPARVEEMKGMMEKIKQK